MKLFVWNFVPHVSDYHHDTGGIVVIARNLDHAVEIVNAACKADDDDMYDNSVDACVTPGATKLDTRTAALRADGHQEEYWFSEPHIIDIADSAPMVWVFPNGGC